MMLTGDNKRSAEQVAHTLGISSVYAEQAPDDKEKFIAKNDNPKSPLVMVSACQFKPQQPRFKATEAPPQGA